MLYLDHAWLEGEYKPVLERGKWHICIKLQWRCWKHIYTKSAWAPIAIIMLLVCHITQLVYISATWLWGNIYTCSAVSQRFVKLANGLCLHGNGLKRIYTKGARSPIVIIIWYYCVTLYLNHTSLEGRYPPVFQRGKWHICIKLQWYCLKHIYAKSDWAPIPIIMLLSSHITQSVYLSVTPLWCNI